jgi:hypothetical protein
MSETNIVRSEEEDNMQVGLIFIDATDQDAFGRLREPLRVEWLRFVSQLRTWILPVCLHEQTD